MKKILLTTVALLSMASASVFGMYGVDTDWIFFLTHGNQFRARLDQLGFTLGNDTIKGTFGFDNNNSFGGTYGGLLIDNEPTGGHHYSFIPSISMGIGYTSSAIGIGVGYNATIGSHIQKYNGKADPKTVNKATHTPVLVLNAMDNALRIAIPIQVFHTTKLEQFAYGTTGDRSGANASTTTNSITAVSLDAQFRYYTGLEALPQIRLYIRYGMASAQQKTVTIDPTDGSNVDTTYKEKFDSFGFDFRLFFGSIVEEVALQPLFRVQFDTACDKYLGSTKITAVDVARNTANYNLLTFAEAPTYDSNPYNLMILGGLGLTANSDVVSVFLRPELGLKVNDSGRKDDKARIGLGWNVYAELYITPIKNLEWYMEIDMGNSTASDYTFGLTGSGINATTGITWYLPAL